MSYKKLDFVRANRLKLRSLGFSNTMISVLEAVANTEREQKDSSIIQPCFKSVDTLAAEVGVDRSLVNKTHKRALKMGFLIAPVDKSMKNRSHYGTIPRSINLDCQLPDAKPREEKAFKDERSVPSRLQQAKQLEESSTEDDEDDDEDYGDVDTVDTYTKMSRRQTRELLKAGGFLKDAKSTLPTIQPCESFFITDDAEPYVDDLDLDLYDEQEDKVDGYQDGDEDEPVGEDNQDEMDDCLYRALRTDLLSLLDYDGVSSTLVGTNEEKQVNRDAFDRLLVKIRAGYCEAGDGWLDERIFADAVSWITGRQRMYHDSGPKLTYPAQRVREAVWRADYEFCVLEESFDILLHEYRVGYEMYFARWTPERRSIVAGRFRQNMERLYHHDNRLAHCDRFESHLAAIADPQTPFKTRITLESLIKEVREHLKRHAEENLQLNRRSKFDGLIYVEYLDL